MRSKAEGLQHKENPEPKPLPGKNRKIALKYKLDSRTACRKLQHISTESHTDVQKHANMSNPRTRYGACNAHNFDTNNLNHEAYAKWCKPGHNKDLEEYMQ